MLRPLALADAFERRDALAGDRFEPFPERRPGRAGRTLALALDAAGAVAERPERAAALVEIAEAEVETAAGRGPA